MGPVELVSVWKTFRSAEGREIHAVRELSLVVGQGESVSVLGPSGCGKTTTLRLIAGLESPTRGIVRMEGRDVTGSEPKDRDVAIVFQNAALFPHMSAYENMAFGLRIRKTPEAEIDRRVREVAEQLEIASCLGRLPRDLSGGECQRVAVGRAFVRRPAVYLFDEPFSSLEATLRSQLRRLVLDLRKQVSSAMIFVTHDLGEAMTLGDRIAVMERGTVLQAGRPADVYNAPASVAVARLIGGARANVISGTVVSAGAEVVMALEISGSGDGGIELVCALAGGTLAKGARVLVGVHSDAITIGPDSDGGADAACFHGTVAFIESQGNERLVHLRIGGHRLVAGCRAGGGVRAGSEVRVRVDFGRACFFDGDSGRRLECVGFGVRPVEFRRQDA